MAAPTKARVIVVGGGLAGLMTAVKIAEAGGTVDLFSLVPVKRSHSVCAQGGINGAVNKYEFWEFVGIIRDQGGSGKCAGIVAQDLRSMEIKSFAADAVVLATGGPGIIFGKSTNSTINTGTAAGAVYQQGAWYANG